MENRFFTARMALTPDPAGGVIPACAWALETPPEIETVHDAAQYFMEHELEPGVHFAPTVLDVTVLPWEHEGTPSPVVYLDRVDETGRPYTSALILAVFDWYNMPPIWQTWDGPTGENQDTARRIPLTATTYMAAINEHEVQARAARANLTGLRWKKHYYDGSLCLTGRHPETGELEHAIHLIAIPEWPATFPECEADISRMFLAHA